jgi:acetolactate synthase-1/2/3 large subunit
MFSATTKKSYIIEDPVTTCDILEEAINLAYDGRPGPVHIHIPKDVTTMEVSNYREIKLDIKPKLPEQRGIKDAVKALTEAMRDNKQIMALIGYGAIRSHAESEVLDFIEMFQIPFATTMDAKGIISEGHPLSLGVYGTSGDPAAIKYFDNSDLILAIGNSFAQNATFAFKEDLYHRKNLIHINIDPKEINKVYDAKYPILSDVKPAIRALHDLMLKEHISVKERKAIENGKWFDLPIEYEGDKIHPGALVKAMSGLLPKNSIVLGDAGSHMLWLNCYLKLTENQRYQNPGSFGPMASHVNGAIGVKCANMDKTVICGCGDGAYLMAGFELLTAVENNIPVLWVIFNNSEFNIIKKLLINNFGEHAFMHFKNPDYVKYAEACGAKSFRVEKLEDFEGAFKEALALNKPAILDVVVESEVYPPFSLGKV